MLRSATETESAKLSSLEGTTPDNLYGVKRRLAKGTISDGWYVHLRRQGRYIIRHFKDSAYGSADAAFHQARAFRDAVLDALPPMTNREKATCLRSDNTSGITGVYLPPVKVVKFEPGNNYAGLKADLRCAGFRRLVWVGERTRCAGGHPRLRLEETGRSRACIERRAAGAEHDGLLQQGAR
ncbi:hypothetical protein SMD10_24670, partial [Consotaella sp. CSK11QG-6]